MIDKLGKFFVVWSVTILMGIVLLIGGCGQTPPKPQSSPQKIEKTQPPPPEEVTEEENAEEEQKEEKPVFSYEPSGRREPFKTLIADEIPDVADVVLIATPEVIQTPLQKFPLDQMKLTGLILGGLGDYARLVAPDGKSYTINIGTLVGNQEGKVISITENAVIVKEIIRYESGKVEEVETPLYLIAIEDEEGKT